MTVYIDTSAWIALHEPRDQHHGRAIEILHNLTKDRVPIVCGWHTVVEFGDGLARHYDQRTAAEKLDLILASRLVRILPSEPHLADALHLLRTAPQIGIDPSDALSAAMMKAHRLRGIFTFDADFEKLGFELAS